MVDDRVFDRHAGANLQQEPYRPEFQGKPKDYCGQFVREPQQTPNLLSWEMLLDQTVEQRRKITGHATERWFQPEIRSSAVQ
jgi:hypothetical protein